MKPVHSKQKLLTVIVVFYNAQREAPRTLHTLSIPYQEGVTETDYDVIVLDNGSQRPLDEEIVKKFGSQFHYQYIDTKSHSPCGAITDALEKVKTPYVMCMIDGAHMLSPGVLKHGLTAAQSFDDPFVYTIPLHLGEQMQNDNMMNGYDQEAEDKLLRTVKWRKNGYALFAVSNIAVSMNSFFGRITESNCFICKTETLKKKGGFDIRFSSPGGGMVNLDIFKNMVEDKEVQPVVLIGEASFHQFHGGISTNVPRKEHPLVQYRIEYKSIRGKKYHRPAYTSYYFGHIPDECKNQAFKPTAKVVLELGRKFLNDGKTAEAIAVMERAKELQPYTPGIFMNAGDAWEKHGNLKEAEEHFRQALAINPITSASYYVRLANVLLEQGKEKAAFENYKQALEIDREDPKTYLSIARAYQKLEQEDKFKNNLKQALRHVEVYPVYNPGFYMALGRFFFGLKKNNKEALRTFELGIIQYPNDARMLFWKARVYMRMAKSLEAEQIFKNLLADNKFHTSRILRNLGTVYKQQKKWGDAAVTMYKALEIEKDNAHFKEQFKECQANIGTDLSKEKYQSFIFTHIPKSGGMSFRRHTLEAAIRSGIKLGNARIPGSNGLRADQNLIQLNEVDLRTVRQQKLTILADHSSYDPVKTYQLNGLENPFFYTILREPFSRIKSYYYYFYYRNGLEGLKGIHLNDMEDDQLDWILGVFSNWQVAYLTDFNRDQGIKINEEVFRQACHNLEHHYPCFGIFEHMNRSMEIFYQEVPGWLKYDNILPQINRNTPIKNQVQLSERVVERIKKLNTWDIALYDFALKLFRKRYAVKEN